MEVGVRLSGYRRRAAAQEDAPPAALEEDDECACLPACMMEAALPCPVAVVCRPLA